MSTTSETPVVICAAASITAGTPSAEPETKHGPRPSSYTRSLLSEPVTALTSPGSRPASASALSPASMVTLSDVSPSSTRAWRELPTPAMTTSWKGWSGTSGHPNAYVATARYARSHEQGQGRLLLVHRDHGRVGAP